MEKIVYLLGAGFSQPLGLPLIGNFWEKAQQMYLDDAGQYAHFEKVFGVVRDMAVVKNWYRTELTNIEEILSILEMNDFMIGNQLREDFVDFIITVIKHYTKPISPYGRNIPGDWDVALFGSAEASNQWPLFLQFVAKLFRLRFDERDGAMGGPVRPYMYGTDGTGGSGQIAYAVLTLNYDMVMEHSLQFLIDQWRTPFKGRFTDEKLVGFASAFADGNPVLTDPEQVYLAKLHGSVDTNQIVPPTWSKGSHPEIAPTWNLAKNLLSQATQIRVIGYSLPVADAYIKYLLKAAMMTNQFLKRFDVICLDRDGSVKQRYDDFVTDYRYQFVNADTKGYLSHLNATPVTTLTNPNRAIVSKLYNNLEIGHSGFMDKNR